MLLLLAPFLGACGLVPLPEHSGKDFHFINTVGQVPPSYVAYMDANQLEYLSIPRLPYHNMTIDAALTYHGASDRLRLQVFAKAARPECPVVPSNRPGYTDALLCDGPGGGVYLSEVLLSPGEPTPLHLASPELDRAVSGGVLYLGVRLLEGGTVKDEWVDVKQIRVRGRL